MPLLMAEANPEVPENANSRINGFNPSVDEPVIMSV
jgi:hypothetical protein